MNLALHLEAHARIRPQSLAVAADPPLTWRALAERVRRVAGGLAGRDVASGDRVAVLSANSADAFVAYLALAWLGAVVVPLNTRLSAAEIAMQVDDAGARAWLVAGELEALAATAAPRLPRLGPPDCEKPARAAPASGPAPVGADTPLGIFYTGGTTGRAKGVVLTHGNLAANARNLAPAYGFTADDVHLHAAPMFHLADLGYLWALLEAGAAHAFLPAWSPQGFLGAMARHRVTTTLLAPAMMTALVHGPDLAGHDLGSWRYLMYGGSPITEDTLRRALAALPCGLWQGYGQTEATHTICMLTPDEHRAALMRPARLRTCGRPARGVEARVARADLSPVSPGETGEVIVRGATVMRGYWNRPAETAEALRDGWLWTGDLATVDEDGYVYLLDRRKDMIVTGGENVYSAEVEQALAAHPAVLEAAVIGVPDDTWGERVHAVVVLAPGMAATPEALQRHCRASIGGYKIPRSFEFVAALPRTTTGKIQKTVLREPHWRGIARRVH